MSDFAKNQLLKFGWSEGKGLGKNENGITKPIKATLKSGVEGLGYKETFDAWWEKKFNSVIQNIQVKSSQDGATLSTVVDDSSKMKENKSKMHPYANFQQICALHNGHLIQNNSTTSEEEVGTPQASVDVSLNFNQFHTKNDEVTPNMATKPPCTPSAKLERIALQDQSLISAMSDSSCNMPCNSSCRSLLNRYTCRRTYRSIFSSHSLQKYSLPLKYTSETKPNIQPNHAILNKVNQTPEEKEKKDEYETNNNIMYTLRTLTTTSKSSNKKFRKKINNLMQQLNSCSIKETESKCDLVKDKFLRNVKGNRKKCLKKKKDVAYAQLIKEELESYTEKEDTSKQTTSQNEKEYRPVIQLEMNDDTPSKQESYKPPHEPLVKGSTCVITLTRFGASRDGDTDMASTKNSKNSLYFHKSKKRRKNKHKHNQRSKIEDVIKNIVNKRDIDFVSKALTKINLTEDVSAIIKKKPTQTHITPV
ncbi:uncharacterized protein LOC116840237 [Odontomachus brunneus]|uniref:uncharacterized protein LOC116840237 n=1 Tax=Odontomachus brunneus TaxID=486640 RepID=UPI0013F255DD|nr:uncharacterized protein LOC116840237 [Odontomachus brunneus]XP_032662622.1 uncharacterized protein LOC116840237 [Odontomachus brunneus]